MTREDAFKLLREDELCYQFVSVVSRDYGLWTELVDEMGLRNLSFDEQQSRVKVCAWKLGVAPRPNRVEQGGLAVLVYESSAVPAEVAEALREVKNPRLRRTRRMKEWLGKLGWVVAPLAVAWLIAKFFGG